MSKYTLSDVANMLAATPDYCQVVAEFQLLLEGDPDNEVSPSWCIPWMLNYLVDLQVTTRRLWFLGMIEKEPDGVIEIKIDWWGDPYDVEEMVRDRIECYECREGDDLDELHPQQAWIKDCTFVYKNNQTSNNPRNNELFFRAQLTFNPDLEMKVNDTHS